MDRTRGSDQSRMNLVPLDTDASTSEDSRYTGYQADVKPDIPPKQHMSAIQILAVCALTMTYIGSQCNTFLAGPGLNFIANGLHIGEDRSWIANSGSLATAAIAPISGNIQDIIGRKGSLVVALVLTIVGTIISGTANSFSALIAGNVISGLGSAVQELSSLAAVAELVPTDKRGLYFGLVTLGTIVWGPSLIYANELSTVSWRWIYWVILIWNGVAAVMAAVTYLPMKLAYEKVEPRWELLKRLDYVGALLWMAGATEILIAINAHSSGKSWTSAYFIVQLLVGVACIGALIFYESFGFGYPIIPFRLFKGQRIIGLTYLICFFSGFFYSTLLNLGPTIQNEVFPFSELKIGLLSLPSAFCLTIGAVLANVGLTVFRGRAREVLFVGAVMQTAFLGAQAIISPSNAATYTTLAAFAALGVGAVLVPLSTVVTIAAPQDLIGTAISLVVSLRTIGGTVGYTIYYTIFMDSLPNSVTTSISDLVLPAGFPKDQLKPLITAFVTSMDPLAPSTGSDVTKNTTILELAHTGFEEGAANAAQYVYYGMIPVGAVIIVLTLCLPSLKPYLNHNVLALREKRDQREAEGS